MLLTMLLLATTPVSARCSATDGDTLRCGRERVRLLGIDAPELPGHCRTNRVCVLGDPWRAKASLTLALRRGPVTLQRVGTDRWGRTLALASAGGVDLSCWQLTTANAVYKPRWDDRALLARTCRAART